VEYLNVSPEWVIEKPKITDVKIMLMGPPQAFQLLNPDTLKVSVDLSQVREGWHEIALSKDMVKKPTSLTVVGISPAQIGMTASRLIQASLPIQVITEGRPPAGLSVQKISAAPPDVRVLIPGKLNQNGIRIRTEPIDLGKVTSTTTQEVRLIFPLHVQFEGGKTPVVKVTIKLKKEKH
jgi:YbbR domain-containing protein